MVIDVGVGRLNHLKFSLLLTNFQFLQFFNFPRDEGGRPKCGTLQKEKNMQRNRELDRGYLIW